MREVVCWCCEYYLHNPTNEKDFFEALKGYCILKKEKVHSEDAVCEDFFLRVGQTTFRSIPNYCKNYHSFTQKP